MGAFLAAFLRPFIALAFLLAAWALATIIGKLLPEGPIKRWLFTELTARRPKRR